jgi:hypothetical protein
VGGGTSTLESWGLDISVAPEPASFGLFSIGLGALICLRRCRQKAT